MTGQELKKLKEILLINSLRMIFVKKTQQKVDAIQRKIFSSRREKTKDLNTIYFREMLDRVDEKQLSLPKPNLAYHYSLRSFTTKYEHANLFRNYAYETTNCFETMNNLRSAKVL